MQQDRQARGRDEEVVISGTGLYLPRQALDNQALYKRVKGFDNERVRISFEKRREEGDHTDYMRLGEGEIFDKWVQQVCGIARRPFISEDEFATADTMRLACERMATVAGERALAAAGLSAADIDHVIYSTYSSNRIMPTPAVTLANFLGLRQGHAAGNMGVSVRTLNGACSGFLDALIDAYTKLRGGYYENILVVAAENMSNKMDFSSPTSCILFGDGAGAFVVSRRRKGGGSAGLFSIVGFAEAAEYSENINMVRAGNIFFEKGPYVQRGAVQAMYGIASRALERCGLSFHDIEYVIPHQANARITAALANKIRSAAKCKVVSTIAFTGNLSSAAIPVATNLLLAGKVPGTPYMGGGSSKYALLTSLGGGYTYSSVIIRM